MDDGLVEPAVGSVAGDGKDGRVVIESNIATNDLLDTAGLPSANDVEDATDEPEPDYGDDVDVFTPTPTDSDEFDDGQINVKEPAATTTSVEGELLALLQRLKNPKDDITEEADDGIAAAPTDSRTTDAKSETMTAEEGDINKEPDAALEEEVLAWFRRPKESKSPRQSASTEKSLSSKKSASPGNLQVDSSAAKEEDIHIGSQISLSQQAEPELLRREEDITGITKLKGAEFGANLLTEPQATDPKEVPETEQSKAESSRMSKGSFIGDIMANAESRGADITANAADSQGTYPREEPVQAKDSKRYSVIGDDVFAVTKYSGEELTAEPLEPQPRADGVEISPPPIDQGTAEPLEPQPPADGVEISTPPIDQGIEDNVSPAPETNGSTHLLVLRPLSDDSKIDTQLSDDESLEAGQKEQRHVNYEGIESGSLGREEYVTEDSQIEGADISENAPTDSQSTDAKEGPKEVKEGSGNIAGDGNEKDSQSNGEEHTVQQLEPPPAAEIIEPSSPPTKETVQEHAAPAKETTGVTHLLDREILFDDSRITIQAFDDGSIEAREKVQGWTNQQWIAASEKVLLFLSPILRAMPGRFFWSSDVYEKRILAIYKNPDVILVMRLPKDVDEVCRLLPIRGGLELSQHDLHAFLVVETVAEPQTCKVRLSQLTNPTSIPSKDLMKINGKSRPKSQMNKNGHPRKRSCFDIFTPTDVATLSMANLPDDSFDDIEYASEKSLSDTHRCEDAIVSALTNAHGCSTANNDTDMAWKHQLVLGTLHSHVVSGNNKALEFSLESALEIQQSQQDSESMDMRDVLLTIDGKDDCGKTALHYACSRRKNSTVQVLVSAGADCSIPESLDGLTPCHICAKALDEKALSIVLSASFPARPDPNALDYHGRTPMYLAAVEGKSEDDSSNAMALDLCLSALEAWGGQLTSDSLRSKELLHPVHCVSAQWKFAELSVVLSRCEYRYPLASSDVTGSLSAKFHYPIHAALVSLRRKIASAFQDNGDNEFNAEFMLAEPQLIKTLRTLLEHGFEPNERFEGIIGQGEAIRTISCYFGFTPLQILAFAAAEARSLELKKHESGKGDVESRQEKDRILRNIMKVIHASTEILMKNGARINVPPPPMTRLDRPTPAGCYSLKKVLDEQSASPMLTACREGLKLDGNNEILNLLGGSTRLNTFQNVFAAIGRTVQSTGVFAIGSSALDSDASGGSDSNSCAICWSEFGVISNRKQLCRVSCRYVCNACSTKRLVVEGSEHRVSDGQFLLAMAERTMAEAKSQTERESQMRKQRQSVTQARKSLGLKSNKSTSSTDTEVKQTKLSTNDRLTSTLSGIGQARNAVLERGDKLESLADKSEALNLASLDFANMAKELNKSQNSWW